MTPGRVAVRPRPLLDVAVSFSRNSGAAAVAVVAGARRWPRDFGAASEWCWAELVLISVLGLVGMDVCVYVYYIYLCMYMKFVFMKG